mgnify:CR=1 FL=1
MKFSTKKLVSIAMLCAVAYVVMMVGRIPIVLFLKYEAKDVIIAIGGFIYGPLTAFIISLIVSVVEMFTVSDTGWIGCVMNILSTCSFACVAAYIYKKNRTLMGAVGGLLAGCLLMVIVMLLWNYLITPIYMGYPREAVAEMLIPVFLPFNLLKGGLNATITMLLYKPVVSALRRGGFVESQDPGHIDRSQKIGVILITVVVLITCIFFALVLKGVI